MPDKRGVGNQICWNNDRFFEYTGTNAFSRIQKGPIPQDGLRAKTRRFPTYGEVEVLLLDLEAKGPGTKSISVEAKVSWYKINFIGLQLYRNESELIPIRGFVPPQFCTV